MVEDDVEMEAVKDEEACAKDEVAKEHVNHGHPAAEDQVSSTVSPTLSASAAKPPSTHMPVAVRIRPRCPSRRGSRWSSKREQIL